MYTVEAAYVFSIVLLTICSILTGAFRLENKISGQITSQLKTEKTAHQPDEEKEYRPEEFIRSVTLLTSEVPQENSAGGTNNDEDIGK